MVLNNYWMWLDYMNSHSFYGSADFNNTNTGMIQLNGNAASVVTRNTSSYGTVEYSRLLTRGITLRVGTGIDDISATDYSLANDITNSLSNLNTVISSYVDTKYNKVITLTGTNNSGNSVAITTVGVCKKFYRALYLDESESCQVMMAKYALETPLIVPNGQGFSITLNWLET